MTHLRPAAVGRRLALVLAAAAVVPIAGGCTAAVWTPATQARAVRPAVVGVVRNYPDRGEQSLVVRYRARGDGTDVDLIVPLDDAGRPVPPFAVAADATGVAGYVVRFPDVTDGGPVAGRVPPAQLAAVLGRAADPAQDRAALAGHFTAADFSPAVGPGVDRPVFSTGTERPGTACLLAYRFDAAGQVVPVPLEPLPALATAAVHVPAGTRLLLVPTDVDRPAGDQGRDQVVAVALTPATVAGDTALLGVGLGVIAVVLPIAIPVAIISAATSPKDAHDAATATSRPSIPAAVEPTGPVPVAVVIDPAPQPKP